MEMSETERLCLYSNLILVPGITILFCYGVFGILLSIPLTYLIVDVFWIYGIRKYECRRIARQKMEEEEERSGRALESIRQKLEELRQIEELREMEEQ